jgi:alkyl hydroperoxide reductase subunit AhpF
MAQTPAHEVVGVGGGPAGLTTALYAARLGHRTALVDREGGRYQSVSHVHHLVGVSEETAGREVTDLRTFPVAPDELDRLGDLDAPAMADDLRARMWPVQEADERAGMTPAER